MTPILIASADDIIEQIVVQCWLFEARDGRYPEARARAERTLERLLSRGLPHADGPDGLRLDPYAANNLIKSRAGEPADEAWPDWQRTTHRNARSLAPEPHLYRLTMRRTWNSYTATAGRPLALRMPLPLRQSQRGPEQVRIVDTPAAASATVRESPGRVELRLDPLAVTGPITAEMVVEFVAGETRDAMRPATTLGSATDPADEIWLRDREGLIAPSEPVAALAAALAANCTDTREFVHRAWDWLMSNLRFGDVHRGTLDASDPLGGLLKTRVADCALGSSLLVALCRARGIPARLLSGYLLHPANLGPHSWAEVLIAPGDWVPFDYGSWCYCAGDPGDPDWGTFFRGRVDARFVAEVAPRDFTGWGSAPPPERWYRLERLRDGLIEHTLHALPDGSLFRRDVLGLVDLGPVAG